MSDTDAAAVSTMPYPGHWEKDVLLADGSTAHLRPVRPDDDDRLIAFYARVSPESKYLRFFAPYPVLSAKDVERFTQVDHNDRVALILTVGPNMVAIGRYDRIDDSEAEVAFLVEDSQQGKGCGQLLLEHLAEAARERGIQRFIAEVLPQNRRMVSVFADAGYKVSREYEDGLIIVEFPIQPTDSSWEVMLRREHRAESTSIHRLLHPRKIAMVGPPVALVRGLEALRGSGFTGELIGVCPGEEEIELGDLPMVPDLAHLPDDLDIVATVLPSDEVVDVIEAVSGKCFGIYAIQGGSFGGEQNYLVIDQARSHGVRLLGPDALGIINTDPEICMNASPAPMPRPGTVSLFCQSSALGVMLLEGALNRYLGLATFISSGLFADVTSNDVMQFWMDDEATDVCLLSLDRIGNPRKFTRILRSLAMQKPVVLFSPGRTEREPRLGMTPGGREAPPEAIDAIFRQSGVIVCSRRDAMYDVAQILVRQPLPAGNRVRVVSNSPAILGHIDRVAQRHGLDCSDPMILEGLPRPERFAEAAALALEDDSCDVVVVALVDIYNQIAAATHQQLFELSKVSRKTMIGVFADFVELKPQDGAADGMGRLPTFSSYADAMEALAAVSAYARWRETDHGDTVDIEPDHIAARCLVREVLRQAPQGRALTDDEVVDLLAAYGIPLVPRYRVQSLPEACVRADELGWDVVLKAGARALRYGPDPGASVFRHLDNDIEMLEAWNDLGLLVDQLGLGRPGSSPQRFAEPVVQKMVPPGVSLEITKIEDPAFGPILSLALAGVDAAIMGDAVYRVPPLTSTDARHMVRELRAAPLLFAHRESGALDISAVEDLLQRVAQLADDLPQLAELTLERCIVSPQGVHVVSAQGSVLPTAAERHQLSRTVG
ncbi:GNAT family N-acetyltransferase [Granulicoccus sp. GXG6511]|uniref:GNAT family N-acetyltransferase n=1 Tax=Granulicoccus sp. GXG6511 TaxID=3381351 RepID=UPI003D7D9FB8